MCDNKKKFFEMNVVNFNQGIENESFLLNSRNNVKENIKTIKNYEVNNNFEKIHRLKENFNDNLKPSVSGCTFLNNKRYRRIGVKKSFRILKCCKMLIGILVNDACEYFLTKLIRNNSKLTKLKGRRFEKSKFFKKNYSGDKIRLHKRNEKKYDNDLENGKEIFISDSNSDKIDGNLITSIDQDFAFPKNRFDVSQGIIDNEECSKTRHCDVIINETPVDSFETIERSFNEIDNEILKKECTDGYEVYHFDDYPFQEETLIISERGDKSFVNFSKSTEDIGEEGKRSENVEKVSSNRSQKSFTVKREKNLNNFKEAEIQKIQSKYIDDKCNDEEISTIGKSLSKLNGDEKINDKMIINEIKFADNYTIYKTKNSFKKLSNVVKNSSIKLNQSSKVIEKEANEVGKLSLVGIKKSKKNYSPIKLFDNNGVDKKNKKNKAKKIINVLSTADLSHRSKDSEEKDSNFVLFSRDSIPVSIELNRISKNLLKIISKKKNFIQTKITSYYPALRSVVSRKEDKPSIVFNKMNEKSSNLRNDDYDNKDNKKENNAMIIENENNLKKEKTDQQRLLPIIESDIILKDPKKLLYSKNVNDFKTAGITLQRLTNVAGRVIESKKKLLNNRMKKLSVTDLCTRSDIIEDSDTSTEKTTVIPPSYSIFSNDQGDRRPILDMNVGLLDSQQREDLLAPWESVDIYEKVNRWHEDTFEP